MADLEDIFKSAPEEEPEKFPEPTDVAGIELAAANALAIENMAGWQRCMADYANLKRETERMAMEISKYAVAGFVEKMLPTVESLRKAADARPTLESDSKRIAQWIDGIVLIRSQLESTLAAAGVTAITEENVAFDPSMHEAIVSEKHDGVEAGKVLKVLEPGWKLHDRVIRPAKVAVAE